MKNRLSLKCFSPPVMIVTFVIEISLAAYTVWRYKMTTTTRLATAILVCLAVFQLAEYNVCEGSFGLDSLSWSRLGYASITMLPPLGFHLATQLAGDTKKRKYIAGAYALAASFAGFFLFVDWGITSHVCLGNYVFFRTHGQATQLYSAYYYGWLIAGTIYAWQKGRQVEGRRSAALKSLTAGYIAFLLPTTTVNVIDPQTIAGIPSIMCGFAVLLAIVLAGEVLPKYYGRTALSDAPSRLVGEKIAR